MEKVNGFYVYTPQKKEEKNNNLENNQNNKQQNNYIEAMFKSNKTPTLEEQYYAEMQQEADLQKTLNGDTKDLPNVEIITSAKDLVLNRFLGGALGSIEGIIDLLIDGAGTVGTWFGADDEWAKNARNYDLTDLGEKFFYYDRGLLFDLLLGPDPVNKARAIGGIIGKTIGNGLYGDQTYEEFQTEAAEHSWFNRDGAGQIVGSVAEGVGGMLPSILIGNIAGAAATGLGATAKAASVASQIASTTAFGMGAAGQATQEALNEGASYEEAKVYGLASGLMETGIEMISGGIGGIGTGVAQKAFPQLTRNAVVKFVSNAAGEGVEEMASEIITPYLKRITYDENAPEATTAQVLEAGLVGALVGAVMEGGEIISKPKAAKIANEIQDLVEIQNEYYEKGQYEKAESISQKIDQKCEEFVAEIENKISEEEFAEIATEIENKETIQNEENTEFAISESLKEPMVNQNEITNQNTTQNINQNTTQNINQNTTQNINQNTTQKEIKTTQEEIKTSPIEVENKKMDNSSTQTLIKEDKKKTYLREIKNVDANFVKAYADLNAKKVFTKEETKEAVNMILDDIQLNKESTVKGRDKILSNLIFEQLNTIKKDTKENIRDSKFNEIAEEIADYVQVTSDTKYSVEERDLAIELTKIDLEAFYNSHGKEGKYVKFEKYFKEKVKTLKKEIADIKELNKVLQKVSNTAKQIKKLKNKRYADRLGGAVVNSKLKAMSKLLGRISVRDFVSSKTRQYVAEYGRLFYNTKFAVENGYEVSETILNDIALFEKNLDKKGSLSLEEAKALERILADAKFKIKKADKIKINGEKVEVPEVSKSIIKTIRNTKFKNTLMLKYINNSVNPRVIFKALDNYTNGYLTQMFGDIQKAETKYYEQYMKFYQPFNDFSKQNKKYIEKLNKEKVDINGKTFKRGEMLSIYMLSQREQAKPHLLENGVVIKDNRKNKKRTIKITEADIEMISNKLSGKDKELISLADNFFNKVAKEEKIKADFDLSGYTNILDENYYFPINTDPTSRFQTIGEPKSDIGTITSIFNYSFNKDIVPGARNEIILTSINMVVQKHARQLAMYTSMSEPIQNLSSVWNRKVEIDGQKTTLKKELSEVWADGYKYIDNLIKDIEGTQIRDETEKIISKIRSNYSVFQLGANVKSILTQFGAIPNAMLYIDATSIAKSYTMKIDFKNMDKYCPYVAFRNFDNDFIKSELLYEQQMNKVQNFFMKGLSDVDRIILGQLWNASQVQVEKDYGHKIGTEANMKEAGQLLEKVTRETQSNSASDKAALVRNKNELVRGFMQFMSSATQNLSVMVESTMEVNYLAKEYKTNKSEKTKLLLEQAKKKAVRAYGSVITGLMFTSLIDKLWKKLRGRDDDEEDEYEILKDIGSNISSLFPFIREIYNKVVEGYEIEHYGLSAINNLLSLGDYDLTTPKGVRSLIYAIGEIAGIPTRNLNNALEVVLNVTGNKTTWDALFYNTDLSEKKKEITTYLNRNRVDKASKVVDTIFTERGLIDTPEVITKKYAVFAKTEIFDYPKTLSSNITINGVEYPLSDDEYSKIQIEYNKAHTMVAKALNYKEFAQLTDINQAKVMNKIYEAYYYQAVDSVIGLEDVSKLKLSIYNKIIPIYKLLIHIYKIKELTQNKTNKKEIAQKYINKLSMSRVQKELMMVYLGYSISNTALIPTIRTFLTSKGIVGEERKYILSLCE